MSFYTSLQHWRSARLSEPFILSLPTLSDARAFIEHCRFERCRHADASLSHAAEPPAAFRQFQCQFSRLRLSAVTRPPRQKYFNIDQQQRHAMPPSAIGRAPLLAFHFCLLQPSPSIYHIVTPSALYRRQAISSR